MKKTCKNFFRKLKKNYYSIEPFPHPYSAMMSINSDVEFTSWNCQADLIKMFAQYDLDVSFSYWMYADNRLTWSIFNEQGRLNYYANEALFLMRLGIIDTIHSFGGVTDGRGVVITRDKIKKGYAFLKSEGVTSSVYTNHGTVQDIQNVGGDWSSYQQGDMPNSSVYHLDLTLDFGVKYFWTDIDYNNESPFFSKDGYKETSSLFKFQTSRDGNPIVRFQRFRGDLAYAPTATSFLDQLSILGTGLWKGYSIIYQHLGIQRLSNGVCQQNTPPYFSDEARMMLRRLSELQSRGEVLITTTTKLLNHAFMMLLTPWDIIVSNNVVRVYFKDKAIYKDKKYKFSLDDFQGWTISVNLKFSVIAYFHDVEIQLDSKMTKEKKYFSVPWKKILTQEFLDEYLSYVY